jgi:hypothetical protein
MKFDKLLTKPIQRECFSNILEIFQYAGNTDREKFGSINIDHLFLADYKRNIKNDILKQNKIQNS